MTAKSPQQNPDTPPLPDRGSTRSDLPQAAMPGTAPLDLPPPPGNLVLTVVGAAAGAGLGALIWCGVEYLLSLRIGYVAVAVGALAGGGAVLLGKTRGKTVGIIAALAGVAGIALGSYMSFRLAVRSSAVRDVFRQGFMQEVAKAPGAAEIPQADKDAACDAAYQEFLREYGYRDYLKDEPGDLAWMGLFGAIGLIVGYRIGKGKGGG